MLVETSSSDPWLDDRMPTWFSNSWQIRANSCMWVSRSQRGEHRTGIHRLGIDSGSIPILFFLLFWRFGSTDSLDLLWLKLTSHPINKLGESINTGTFPSKIGLVWPEHETVDFGGVCQKENRSWVQKINTSYKAGPKRICCFFVDFLHPEIRIVWSVCYPVVPSVGFWTVTRRSLRSFRYADSGSFAQLRTSGIEKCYGTTFSLEQSQTTLLFKLLCW